MDCRGDKVSISPSQMTSSRTSQSPLDEGHVSLNGVPTWRVPQGHLSGSYVGFPAHLHAPLRSIGSELVSFDSTHLQVGDFLY